MDRDAAPRTASPDWLLYDAGCGLCTKLAHWAEPHLVSYGIGIAPLQDPAMAAHFDVPAETLLADIRFLRADGRQFAGADVYREILRRRAWSYPLYAASRLPGVRALFDRTYRWIADNRTRISDTCGIEPPAAH